MLIQLAESDAQILGCFPTVVQLRPHLNADEFVDRVRRQMLNGYRLAFVQDKKIQGEGEIDAVPDQTIAVAGFRISECLAWGKFLYVDELVVTEQGRSQGYGQQLLQWLMDYAEQQHCEQFHLDSGVQRFEAHRFYFRQRLSITCYHFARLL
ncbi:MAG: GNAT family N-acetyltransferase [Oscillatoriophycideae cyanobacterium NC_groundwater_1537_Pr4_S-0.65um_50_18]|nr:GNAT family N-acetyltransferase [Oscillatoriophycideae cyanobacterium NC_groundwater_1537_Pr4_S-0.65um_50_18]